MSQYLRDVAIGYVHIMARPPPCGKRVVGLGGATEWRRRPSRRSSRPDGSEILRGRNPDARRDGIPKGKRRAGRIVGRKASHLRLNTISSATVKSGVHDTRSAHGLYISDLQLRETD